MEKSAIKILILDDESFMQKLLAHMLTGLGFSSVTTCDNGFSALQKIDDPENRPDLILLDLNMPDMDGVEFVRKLVEHDYTGSLVLVSGENERVLQMAEKLVQAHHITVLGHMMKPVALVALASVMDKWRPPEILHSAKKKYSIEELRTAIDNDELVNHYQPKVNVASGDVVGVETLVRWCHPVDGLVLPDQFIDLAETHGLIDELTRKVMVNAMKQARDWQMAGLHLRVAVNVSMDNLSSVTFADFVAEQAEAAGVAPQNFIIELTESRLMLDQRAPLEILTRLRLKRFHLSIDDFGTGHSSLTQLRDISFDELKIDRSFVHGAWRDESARSMYYVSLALGEQFGMQVVAEGVEDRDDWDLVRQTGCDLAQGYFIARPMLAQELIDWMPSWNTRCRDDWPVENHSAEV